MNLELKIKNFYETKKQADTFKKDADKLNSEVKSEMRVGVQAGGKKELVVGDLKAVFSIQERTSMNGDKLLQRLKDMGLTKAIKTIEVPDEDALEDMIYNGELEAEKIADCNETKNVEVLKVAPIKKKKGDK